VPYDRLVRINFIMSMFQCLYARNLDGGYASSFMYTFKHIDISV